MSIRIGVSCSTLSSSSISTSSSDDDPGDISYTDMQVSKEENSGSKKDAKSTNRESDSIGRSGSPFADLLSQVGEAINSGNAFAYITEQRMLALRKLAKNFASFAIQSGNHLMEGLFFVGFWILAMFFMVCLHLFTSVYDMFSSRRSDTQNRKMQNPYTPTEIPRWSLPTQALRRSSTTEAQKRISPTDKSSARKPMGRSSIALGGRSPSTLHRRNKSTSPSTSYHRKESTSPLISHRRKESTSPSTSHRRKESTSPLTSHRRKESMSPSTSHRRKESTSPSTSSNRRRESRSPKKASSTQIDVTAIRKSLPNQRAASDQKPQSQSTSGIMRCPSRIPTARPSTRRAEKKSMKFGDNKSDASENVYVQRTFVVKKATLSNLPQLIKQKPDKSPLKSGSRRSARKYPSLTKSAAKKQEMQAQVRAQKAHVGHTQNPEKCGSGSTVVVTIENRGAQCADSCTSN